MTTSVVSWHKATYMDTIEAARLAGARERLMQRVKELITKELPGCGYVICTFNNTALERQVSTTTSLQNPKEMASVLLSVLDAIDEASTQQPEPDEPTH